MNWPIWWVIGTGAACASAGLLWLVQTVIYPSFRSIPPPVFPLMHADHCRRISWTVLPIGLAEAVATSWWWWHRDLLPPPCEQSLGPTTILLAVAWFSTFTIQVPLHDRLGREYAQPIIQQLIATNWLRTATLTLRAALLLSATWAALGDQ